MKKIISTVLFSALVAVSVMAHEDCKKSCKKACCQSKETGAKPTSEATPTTTEHSHAGCNHGQTAAPTESASTPAAKQCSGSATPGKPCCASKGTPEKK